MIFQGMEADEICMNMETEIEEIVYEDKLTCNHVMFESCHDSFKSVLRKSMVMRRTLYNKVKNSRHFTFENFSRLRSVKPTTSRSATFPMRSVPRMWRLRRASNHTLEIVTRRVLKSVPWRKMQVMVLIPFCIGYK